jgi:uncharacterized membrane protein
MNELTVRECLSFGWRTFKIRPWLFVSAWLVLTVVGMIAGSAGRHSHMAHPESWKIFLLVTIIAVFFRILGMIVSVYTDIGMRNFALKAHDEPEAVELHDLIHLKAFWRYLGMSIVFFVSVVIGFILLIVPGIIIAIGWSFAPYLVIEQGAGPIDALKRSWELTRGNRWKLFLLGLALIGINILGVCALLVGLLVTLPVTTLAGVHAYRTLLKIRTASVEVPVS